MQGLFEAVEFCLKRRFHFPEAVKCFGISKFCHRLAGEFLCPKQNGCWREAKFIERLRMATFKQRHTGARPTGRRVNSQVVVDELGLTQVLHFGWSDDLGHGREQNVLNDRTQECVGRQAQWFLAEDVDQIQCGVGLFRR